MILITACRKIDVTASSSLLGDVTNNIWVEGTVDTLIEGDQEIKYLVMGGDHKEHFIYRVITVLPPGVNADIITFLDLVLDKDRMFLRLDKAVSLIYWPESVFTLNN